MRGKQLQVEEGLLRSLLGLGKRHIEEIVGEHSPPPPFLRQ